MDHAPPRPGRRSCRRYRGVAAVDRACRGRRRPPDCGALHGRVRGSGRGDLWRLQLQYHRPDGRARPDPRPHRRPLRGRGTPDGRAHGRVHPPRHERAQVRAADALHARPGRHRLHGRHRALHRLRATQHLPRDQGHRPVARALPREDVRHPSPPLHHRVHDPGHRLRLDRDTDRLAAAASVEPHPRPADRGRRAHRADLGRGNRHADAGQPLRRVARWLSVALAAFLRSIAHGRSAAGCAFHRGARLRGVAPERRRGGRHVTLAETPQREPRNLRAGRREPRLAR